MTLYISALSLDAHAHRQLNITDHYSLHRVVYSLFEDVRSEQQKHGSVSSGIQWVDKGGDIRGRKILIMADRPPCEPRAGKLETKILSDTFLSYPHYRFSVCLNPTRRNKQTGKQVPVTARYAGWVKTVCCFTPLDFSPRRIAAIFGVRWSWHVTRNVRWRSRARCLPVVFRTANLRVKA